MGRSAALRHFNGVNFSKLAIRPSVMIPAVVVPSPQQVIPVNIQRVERLILDNRRMTCREIAQKTNISMGTVNTIIHEHLHFRKVSARWLPRQISAFDRHRRVEGCTELKEHFDREGQDFPDRIITCDETW